MRGCNVCQVHGGSAPHVRAAAKLRLAALVDPAIGVVQSALKNKKRPDLALKAAHDVLDRNELNGKQKIALEADIEIQDKAARLADILTPEQLAELAQKAQ